MIVFQRQQTKCLKTPLKSGTTTYIVILEQMCPTHGPRAACGPLGKLVRPFLLLSSLIPFLRVGKFFEGGQFC